MSKALNHSQIEAVEYVDGPLLIVAGAGTGKTTVITEKIAYLIREKLATPEQILALTFTDKAAQEMQERIDTILDLGYSEMAVSTFHVFCQRLLEQYGLDIGLPNQPRLFSETDAWLLVREHLYEFGLDYYRPLGNPTRHIKELLRHFSKCKDELISAEEYLEYAQNQSLDQDDVSLRNLNREQEVANAYHRYNQLLLDNNALDFADLIYHSVRLLQTRPHIKKQVQSRYKYILVDEFQDVNWAQYKLVTLLAEQSQLTVVGDDDQAIYSFRGASVFNIMRFKDDFPNAKNVVLNENYRSAQRILDAAYASIVHNNPDRLEVKLGIEKKLISQAQVSDPQAEYRVQHTHFPTGEDEAEGVVNEIIRLKTQDTSLLWDDFLILARANAHVDQCIKACERLSVPFEFLASSGLFRQPIVLDCLAFFRAVENYHDSLSVYRLLRLPCLPIHEQDLRIILTTVKKKSSSYMEIMKRAGEIGVSLDGQKLVHLLITTIEAAMKQIASEKPQTILYGFLEKSGYLEYLAREEGQGNREVIRQIRQLKQFFTVLDTYSQTHADVTISHFLTYMDQLNEAGDDGKLYQPTDTPDSVNIMTVHGSKGLEYRYVFIVNLVEDRFPTRRRGEGIELPLGLIREKLPEGDYHLQEERRLCYVAMTRAKERLYLTSADSYGGVRKKKISRFVSEVCSAMGSAPSGGSLSSGHESFVTAIKQTQASVVGREHKATDAEYVVPKKFSFSQIQSYRNCPYQYKLAHVLKLPTKSSASFSFGTTMHATLQAFYERVKQLNSATQHSLFDLSSAANDRGHSSEIRVPPLEDLLSLYDEKWIGDWYKDKQQREQCYNKGRLILRTFYAAQEGHWTVPVALEGWFKIKLGEYLMHGRIDRIDRHPDGSLEIIDYKTGQSKEKVVGEEKDQLLIYQIAAESLPEYYHLGKPEKLTFYYLNDNIQTSFIGKSKELEQLKEKLISVIDQIQARNFPATPSEHTCAYCDFKDICEYRA